MVSDDGVKKAKCMCLLLLNLFIKSSSFSEKNFPPLGVIRMRNDATIVPLFGELALVSIALIFFYPTSWDDLTYFFVLFLFLLS